jgi:hypothetical protein
MTLDVAARRRAHGYTLRFVRGEQVKEFAYRMPVPIDRGVWTERAYERGDEVSWGGSVWRAQRDNPGKPGDGADNGWRLAVKKGRDGRDGKNGAPGERGPEGRPGRDGGTY